MAQAYGRSDIGYMHNNEQQQQPQQQQQQHTALGFSGVMMSGQQGSSLLSNGMHGGGMQQQQQQQQMQQQEQQQQGQGQGQQSQSQDGGDGQPAQAEYTLAGILHFLQSEWRRYERDRNEWEIERAEMRARIALLEGERKGTENLKTDLMRRVKMLEYALRQERNKYLSSSGNTTTATPQAPGSTVSGIPASKFATLQGLERAASSSGRSSPARADSAEASPPAEGPGVRGSTFSTVSFNPNTLFGGTINGSTIGGPGAALSRQPTTNSKDPRARAKSRDYLKQCLQEISYLTSASTLNPLPERAAGPASAGQARPRKTMPDVAPPTFQAPPAPEGAPPTQLQSPLTDSLNRRAGPPNAAANRRPIAPQGSSQPRAGPRGLGVGAASRPLHLSTEPLVEPLTEEPEQHGATDVNAATQAEHGNAADPLGATQHHAEESTEQAEEAAATPYYVEGDAPPPAPSAGVTDLPEESRSANDERGEEQEDEDQVTAVFRGAGGDPANANASDWAKLKEAGQREREKRERMRQAQQGAAGGAPDAAALALTSERVAALIKASSGNAQSTPGSKADDHELASLTMVEPDAGAAATARTDEEAAGTMWKSKVVLRSHLDAVRAIAFDGTDVVSASDDKTIKFWRLDLAALEAPGTRASADTEPIVTLRGHTAPVTCLAVASNARRLYSGAMDASIRVWRLPDRSTTPYPPFENRELATLVGHTQAVWDMALLPLAEEGAVLASASADGTVKIWNTTPEPASLRLSWDYFGTEASDEAEAARASGKPLPVPTSVSVVHSDLRVCAVAYSNSVVKLFDVESGRQVMQLKSDETYDGTPARQINKVVTHPTLPILVTAHEDQYIRMFDLTTGACTLSQLAHLDAVTSLDIDPAGLTLVSGSNDLSLRFWDVNFSEKAPKAVCVQEMTAHRPKGGEGVLAVLYHPTAPFFFSAAADGCLRAYG